MKKLLLLVVVFCLAYTTKAQISDRANDDNTYLLGARPVAGNFGFYLGMSTVDLKDVADDTVSAWGIPIINIKYYYTDKLVLKGGIHIWKKRRSLDGELDYLTNSASMTAYKHTETDASWKFLLGVEKHFDLSNIIDAYVGLNGNLGYGRSVRTNNISYFGGDYFENEGSNFGIIYGGETIIGLNFFIADLPIAVGFEYGCSFKNYGANKFKYDYNEYMGGVSSSGTYYTSLIDDFEDAYANEFHENRDLSFTDLEAKRFDIKPLARLTLTYYLKR